MLLRGFFRLKSEQIAASWFVSFPPQVGRTAAHRRTGGKAAARIPIRRQISTVSPLRPSTWTPWSTNTAASSGSKFGPLTALHLDGHCGAFLPTFSPRFLFQSSFLISSTSPDSFALRTFQQCNDLCNRSISSFLPSACF